MKKIILIICLFFCISCSSFNDINNLAIANEIAIDYSDEYKIYLKVLSSNEHEIYTENCKILDDCFSSINDKLTKKMYLSHLDLLIFSSNLEDTQYDEIFAYFLNNNSTRNTFTVAIVDKITDEFIEIDSKDIKNLIDLNKQIKNKTLDMIFKERIESNISYIPYIDTEEIKIIGYKSIGDNNG